MNSESTVKCTLCRSIDCKLHILGCLEIKEEEEDDDEEEGEILVAMLHSMSSETIYIPSVYQTIVGPITSL